MAKEKKEQQYHRGDKVRVVNIGSPFWESENGEMKIYDRCPEAIGQVGEIVGSYNDLFPSKMKFSELQKNGTWGEPKKAEENASVHYEIKWPEESKLHVAWWYEYQLEAADANTPREQQQHYPDYKESNMAKELIKMAEKMEMEVMWGK
jgi:hypothetical protein